MVGDGVGLMGEWDCDVCVWVCSQISITESRKVLLQTLDTSGNIQEVMEISGDGLDVSLRSVYLMFLE